MDDMQNKLNAILGDPQMMQQIMAMAQAMGQQGPASPPQPVSPPQPPTQEMPAFSSMPDPAMLQRIAGIARQAGVDKNQQALLKALSPYLSRERIAKLEKAMRAAKIAGIAATALGGSGLSFLTGR